MIDSDLISNIAFICFILFVCFTLICRDDWNNWKW